MHFCKVKRRCQKLTKSNFTLWWCTKIHLTEDKCPCRDKNTIATKTQETLELCICSKTIVNYRFNDLSHVSETLAHDSEEKDRSRRLRYPGGQTQPEMQGVLGGQVRFNIRLRQVGAQATPPLCSAQLWYTFPSGHSPTSPLSGSATCTYMIQQN